jgi:hypothetical protein
MLGIGFPDRHALPRITPIKCADRKLHSPPARAGSFNDPSQPLSLRGGYGSSCPFPDLAPVRRGVASCLSRFPRPVMPLVFDSGPSRIRGKDRGEAAGRGHQSGISASRNASATRAYKSVWLFDCYTRSETDLK